MQNSVIMDYFAGSGTMGQAVLEYNRDNGGNRKFILITNNENSICDHVTYPRLKKVIEGYSGKDGVKYPSTPGSLSYFK
jgi:adenine-specific DNA-methyltransferase